MTDSHEDLIYDVQNIENHIYFYNYLTTMYKFGNNTENIILVISLPTSNSDNIDR